MTAYKVNMNPIFQMYFLFGDHLFVDVNSTSVLYTTIENISSKRFYAFNGE